MHFSRIIALAASVSTAAAQVKGFNYGSTFTDNSAKQLADFENEFKTAQGLVGASGFASARLYTMIQAGTANTPISAIQAAINTKTSLLLGLWISGDPNHVNDEIAALKSAISQYGTAFTDLIIGISVGEDLYRETPEGIASNAGPGVQAQQIVAYIQQVRDAIKGTVAASASIGHVDTWTTFVNASNSAVIAACDWVGMDAYPYFQTSMANSIANSKSLFYDALGQAQAQGKPVWVTETGWPVSGETLGQAEASVANAKTYWDEVGCSLFGTTNTWWYTLQDAAPYPAANKPSFGIVGSTLSTTPLFDLTCGSSVSNSSSLSASSASASASASASSSAVLISTPAPSAAASAPVADNAPQAASSASAGGASALPSSNLMGSNAAPSASEPAAKLSAVDGLTKPSAGTITNVGSDGVTTVLVVTMETMSACHA